MTTNTEAMRAALEASQRWHNGSAWRYGTPEQREAWAAHRRVLDAALTQAEQRQEAQTAWVGLTDGERSEKARDAWLGVVGDANAFIGRTPSEVYAIAREEVAEAVESELRAKNAAPQPEDQKRIRTNYCCPDAVGTGKVVCDECAKTQADYSNIPSILRKQAP
jgi:hypothetical protein